MSNPQMPDRVALAYGRELLLLAYAQDRKLTEAEGLELSGHQAVILKWLDATGQEPTT